MRKQTCAKWRVQSRFQNPSSSPTSSPAQHCWASTGAVKEPVEPVEPVEREWCFTKKWFDLSEKNRGNKWAKNKKGMRMDRSVLQVPPGSSEVLRPNLVGMFGTTRFIPRSPPFFWVKCLGSWTCSKHDGFVQKYGIDRQWYGNSNFSRKLWSNIRFWGVHTTLRHTKTEKQPGRLVP